MISNKTLATMLIAVLETRNRDQTMLNLILKALNKRIEAVSPTGADGFGVEFADLISRQQSLDEHSEQLVAQIRAALEAD